VMSPFRLFNSSSLCLLMWSLVLFLTASPGLENRQWGQLTASSMKCLLLQGILEVELWKGTHALFLNNVQKHDWPFDKRVLVVVFKGLIFQA
jgi:hypothetical protein